MVNKQYSATDLEAFMKIAANWQSGGQGLMEGVDIKSEMQQYMNSPAMNMYKKRERTQNWNHQEKKYLLELCRKDMRIIENKRLDAGLTAVKNKAWKIIHQKFSKQFGTDRTCNRLKEQWRRMKACTRNEIIDYNNRMQRQGQEVADRKRPTPFTFEVWDFMQEAKRVCKSEALDGIDYSKIPLALEEDYEYREDEQNGGDDEHDMDESRTPPQELCDIDIKEETNETLNDNYTNNNHNNNNDAITNGIGERLNSSSPHPSQRSSSHEHERLSVHSPHSAAAAAAAAHAAAALMEHNGNGFLTHNGGGGGGVGIAGAGAGDLVGFQTPFHMSNLSATLEALSALRNGQFPTAAAISNLAAAAAVQQAQQANAAQQQQQQQQQQHQQDQHNSFDEDQQHDIDSPSAKRPRRSSSGDVEQQQTQLQPLTNGLSLSSSSSISNNAINNLNSANSTPELRCFMEMQAKEHMMRMNILEIQLQAAKYNRDLLEINKTIAAQKLRQLGGLRH